MRSIALAVLSGWLVLRAGDADRCWPWRVVDLQVEAVTATAGRSRGPAPRRRPPRRADRAHLADAEALERDLPGAVDLLRLAISAGHTLHGAVTMVANHGTGPVAAALGDAVAGYGRGGRLVDELEGLPSRRGAALRPLTTTLVVAASSGTPLGPALQRLAEVERRRLRRRTEERVRRLPVLLLGPLIGLVLPAFVVLTIVPVGIATARAGFDAGRPAVHDLPSDPVTDTPRNPP